MSSFPIAFEDAWARPPYCPFHSNETMVISKPRVHLKPVMSTTSRKYSGSIFLDNDKFEALLDIQQFSPDEVSVNVCGNEIIVDGKHEEKQDEQGFISRHFVRKYILPDGYDIRHVQSELSTDGVLSITAPKIDPQEPWQKREIPILRTGRPSKAK